MERDAPNFERQISIEARLVAHGIVDRYGNGPEGRTLSAMLKSVLKR